jgi:hypothetical protein
VHAAGAPGGIEQIAIFWWRTGAAMRISAESIWRNV